MVKENSKSKDVFRVTLLGTGAPPPVMERFGPGILVEAGEIMLLFDAGRGVLQRLYQLKTPLNRLRSLFLTHLHSDHIVGLPDLWLTGWLVGRPEIPLSIWGPRGVKEMMAYLDKAFDYDIRIRSYDDRLSPRGVMTDVEEISEGVVYDKDEVIVTAFEVDHSPIWPAFGYRIDYRGRSVLLSGDTRVTENLIRYAKGVDVIIHEIVVAGALLKNSSNLEATENVIAHHTTEKQAGEIFKLINPKLAVLSHIIPWNAAPGEILSPIREHYDGPLEVGEDLMVIDIGEEATVIRPG